ncbi:MAG: tetratricopeptide repeat protein [candidate division WOR-3 bacterium]
MKKLVFIFLLSVSILIFSQEVNDIFKQVIILENEAFDIFPAYGKVLRGEGLVSDIDFDLMREKYREILQDGDRNPFIYLAYGFTFHYKKEIDSASFYFQKASEKSGLDYLLHLRLYQIFSVNVVKNYVKYELDQLEKLKYMVGATSLPEISMYLNILAIENYRNKNIDEAFSNLLLANKLDPFNFQIVNNILNLSLKEKRFEYTGFALSRYKNYFRDDVIKFVFLFNILKFLRYFILLIFIFYTLIFTIKNLDKYFYFYKRYVKWKLLPKQRIFLALIVLLIPLILQINVIIWFFYVVFLVFIFYEKKEKIIISVLILLIFFIPLIYRIESHIIGHLNPNDNISVILKVENSYWNTKLLNKLNSLLEEQPYNTALLFSKGKLYKKGGFFDEAESEYSKILLKGESFPELYNNLGNIMFLKGYYNKAIEYYNKAIQIYPDIAESYFNLGQVYLKLLRLEESNQYIEKANRLNYELISTFLENTDENFYNTVVIDCKIPERFIYEEFLKKKNVMDTPVMMGIRIDLFNIIPFFTLVLSLILNLLTSQKVRIFRCYTCNTPISNGDKLKYNDKDICLDDYKTISDTISDIMKIRKFESFVRLKKKKNYFVRKILSLIFPGFGKIYEGRYFKGGILMVFSLISLIFIFSQNIFLRKNTDLILELKFFDIRFLFVFLIIIFYLISFLTIKEEK